MFGPFLSRSIVACSCVCVCGCVGGWVVVYVCMCVWVYVCMCVCVSDSLTMRMCSCVCVCVKPFLVHYWLSFCPELLNARNRLKSFYANNFIVKRIAESYLNKTNRTKTNQIFGWIICWKKLQVITSWTLLAMHFVM